MVTTFAGIIALWPNVSGFAADMGLTVEHAAAMKRRNSIPPAHWQRLVGAAEARGIRGVSFEMLAVLAAQNASQSRASDASDAEEASAA